MCRLQKMGRGREEEKKENHQSKKTGINPENTNEETRRIQMNRIENIHLV